MKVILTRWLSVVSLFTLTSINTGCVGPANSIPSPASREADPGTSRAVDHPAANKESPAADKSWIEPNARSQDLLYVTDYSYVTVYSYPQGKIVGTLKGFKSAVGDCVDKQGNVFVTNHLYAHGETRIAKYVHGGDKPVAELANDKHVGPLGCSVDPLTGDLAISGGGSSLGAGVDIFRAAKGKPSFVKIRQMVFTQFCGFDNQGNLFVDGLKDWSGQPAFAELSKGAKKFVIVKLDAVIDSEGGVQWDGKHIAIGAYKPPGGTNATPVIYRFAISGGRGVRVSTTKLGSPAHVTSFQFAITPAAVVVPNWYYVSNRKYNVLFFDYPKGGAPTMTLTKHVFAPRGATVSFASRS